MKNSHSGLFTVGELAKETGVTVRTLQYYDKCKLLIPAHSEGGRRLYNRHDIFLLQQILFLKSFGFSLEEIRDRLIPEESSAEQERLLTRQKEVLHQQIASLQETEKMMAKIIQEIHAGKEIGADKFVALMWMMGNDKPLSFVLRYLGNDEVTRLFSQFNEEEEMEAFSHMNEALLTDLLALSRSGADPSGKEGQEFAEQWWNMIATVTKGDPALLKTLMSVGADVDNWPSEVQEFQEAIKTFLTSALDIYFRKNNIQFQEGAAHE